MHKIDEHEEICASIVPIFGSLSRQELEKVNTLIQKKTYPRGSMLFLKGDPAHHLCIIRSGRVKLYDTANDGRQQIVRILEHGDCFGELSLFKSDTYTVNAETMEETGICFLLNEDLNSLIHNNPSMSWSIMQVLTERLAYAEQFISDLTLKSIEERIASWLLVMAEKHGVHTPEGIRVTLTISRIEVANLLSSTQETVSRKLSQLQSGGIIKLEGHKTIIILNRKQLAAIVDYT